MICKVKLINELDRNDDLDLTLFLISKGMAWWLSEPSQTEEERTFLKDYHNAAKSTRIGLWGQEGRKLRPSTWRERNRIFGMTSNPFEDISE